MSSIWTFLRDELFPHYPFILGYMAFVFFGQFFKAQLWTKERAETNKFFAFMRRTLAMHAPAAGFVIGLIPGMVASPGIEAPWGTAVYWLGCGVLASFSFHALSDYIKKRTNGDLDLDGAIARVVSPSMHPPPLPEAPPE